MLRQYELIGNGSPVIGQAVDFEKRNYDLEYDLTRFGTLDELQLIEQFVEEN